MFLFTWVFLIPKRKLLSG